VSAGRRRTALFALLLALVALDVGRSIYARRAYAEPRTMFDPDPKVYARIKWPPGSDVAPGASLGAKLYAQHCALCHGPDGRGNGPAAPSMIPRPRDFTLGQYKYKTTQADAPPTEDDLFATVRDGLPGAAMPYFSDLMSEAELRAVVRYVESMSEVFGTEAEPAPRPPQPTPVAPSAGQQSVERGKKLYTDSGCAACHGADLRGGKVYPDAKGHPLIARDLTAPWAFRGGASREAVWLRLTVGMASGPMPSFGATLSDEERWALADFIGSAARTPPWAKGGRLGGPGTSADPATRGAYLVHFEMCGLCHTQIEPSGIYDEQHYLAGGMRVGLYPHGFHITRNLTSDPETGVGGKSIEQIVSALRNGRASDRVLNPFAMLWPNFHPLTEEDARAIATHLKTGLAPVRNRIGPPARYGFIETVLAKLTRPMPAVPKALTYAEGDFGSLDGSSTSLPLQDAMVIAQWVLLAVALALSALGGRPRSVIGWLGVVGALLLGLGAWLLYDLPLQIPAEQFAGAAAPPTPMPDTSKYPPQIATLVQRGHYLYQTASCAVCHGPDAKGGMPISWRPMGTVWSRNLTPDVETGLGGWSDAEIRRAIRSGIAKSGRKLHWQAMIWDHLSNLDEEDTRALIAFLRALPPTRNPLPAPTPPSDADCAVYTVYLEPSHQPGCHGD
jgi:mono/diheme cytochrome c family protein